MADAGSSPDPTPRRKWRRRAAGSLLTGDEIQDLGIISENFEPGCSRPTSYDLRLGREILRPNNRNGVSENLLGDTPLVIPKFSSVIVSSHEIVRLPGNVAGKFNLKIKMALQGLFVQMGTQVEPNYHGRLFALLQNISDQEIVLHTESTNGKIFAIEFYYTSKAISKERSGFSTGKVEQIGQFVNEVSFSGTINNVTTELEGKIQQLEASRDQLASKITKLEESIETILPEVTRASERIFTVKTALIGGALFAALALIVAVISPIVAKAVFDRLAPVGGTTMSPSATTIQSQPAQQLVEDQGSRSETAPSPASGMLPPTAEESVEVQP